jgi:hypothetical protein
LRAASALETAVGHVWAKQEEVQIRRERPLPHFCIMVKYPKLNVAPVVTLQAAKANASALETLPPIRYWLFAIRHSPLLAKIARRGLIL